MEELHGIPLLQELQRLDSNTITKCQTSASTLISRTLLPTPLLLNLDSESGKMLLLLHHQIPQEIISCQTLEKIAISRLLRPIWLLLKENWDMSCKPHSKLQLSHQEDISCQTSVKTGMLRRLLSTPVPPRPSSENSSVLPLLLTQLITSSQISAKTLM